MELSENIPSGEIFRHFSWIYLPLESMKVGVACFLQVFYIAPAITKNHPGEGRRLKGVFWVEPVIRKREKIGGKTQNGSQRKRKKVD